MSDLEVQPVTESAPLGPGLSQLERVTNTFSAPSKTFEDIKNRNKSWWLPFIIMVLIGYVFFAAITLKVGWSQVAENAIRLNPKAEEKLAQAPPDQRAMTMKFTQYSMEGGFAASPILILVFVALGSLILWGTINFVFGGKATFGSVFTVWMYAGLPGIIKTILGTIVIYTGGTPETFNLNNFAPTSIGAFLSPAETNAALYKLASAIDVTTIWSMILMGIGLAIVARVKRSSGYVAVFGWWAITVLVGVGYAAITG
jgi:MFS family permease